MIKLFVLSDLGVSSGYGRIAAEIMNRVYKRGVDVFAASVMYDGKLPAQYEGKQFPYWVGVARPMIPGTMYDLDGVINMINAYQPDIIHVIQDFPFAMWLRDAPLDWSKFGFMITTPVDGAPIYPKWIDLAQKADALLTISQYGVNAFREQGVKARLCLPAANLDDFYPLPPDERLAIRAKLGIEPDAFVMGMVAMNQGRKAIPQTLYTFFEFTKDKPNARLLMNMDAVSPAGWDIPALCQQHGWDVGKIIFKIDAVRRGVTELRERYNVMDVHSVLSYREGFGLPLVEGMACGVLTAAMDYSSGTEIVGEGRGILVKATPYFHLSTWGGAADKLSDYNDYIRQLQHFYDHKEDAAATAKRGMEWARGYTWDMAADATMTTIQEIMERRKKATPAPVMPVPTPPPPAVEVAPPKAEPELELIETEKAG